MLKYYILYPPAVVPDWWCCGAVPFSCHEMKTNGTVTVNIFPLITRSPRPVPLPGLERFLFLTQILSEVLAVQPVIRARVCTVPLCCGSGVIKCQQCCNWRLGVCLLTPNCQNRAGEMQPGCLLDFLLTLTFLEREVHAEKSINSWPFHWPLDHFNSRTPEL